MPLIISTIYIYAMSITLLLVSDSFWNNLPTLITAIVAGLISLYGALKAHQANRHGKENKVAIAETKSKVVEVAKSIDGLLEKKAIADEAKGKLQGIQQEKADQKDRDDSKV